jgi:hypothetical protein
MADELQFWGLNLSDMETCCWKNFYDWESTKTSLETLENSLKLTAASKKHRGGIGGNFCNKVWAVVMNKKVVNKKVRVVDIVLFEFIVYFYFCLKGKTCGLVGFCFT